MQVAYAGYSGRQRRRIVRAATRIHHQGRIFALEQEKSELLLAQFLPMSIVEQLRAGKVIAPESFTCTSIVFADVVGFAPLAHKSTPVQVPTYIA